MTTIKELLTLEEFDQFEKEESLHVVHFMAEWAPQCEQINNVLEELQKLSEMKDVKFAKVSAEDIPEASMKHKIIAVPTVLLFLRGKLIDRVDGADATILTKKVKTHAAKYSLTFMPASVESEKNINERLKEIINASKCMVFMKGSPDSPRCGFSKILMEILEKYNTEFGSFDILTDDEVRQGLKKYSNWPTYPQLYIDGDLIGGLDIIKEMDNSKELESMLPKKENLDDKLSKLIRRSPLMVFMKGDPSQPQCGFSKQLVQILNEIGVEFDSFDILNDDEVRQGLKTYSSWPTYPQVYCKGDLLGGLDIIKEMKDDGSLLEALKDR